nr:MAG TPA: hypothetical protein [Caudoviricetes sp.]
MRFERKWTGRHKMKSRKGEFYIACRLSANVCRWNRGF